MENRRILVAEDVELNQFLAKEIMESWGCVVEIVENGLLALEKVSRESFDLVLMDIQMPEMDGMSATTHIRGLTDAGKASIPIIALTANATERERQLYLSLGMNDCISKPFEERVLFEVVSKCINQHSVSGQTFSSAAVAAATPSAYAVTREETTQFQDNASPELRGSEKKSDPSAGELSVRTADPAGSEKLAGAPGSADPGPERPKRYNLAMVEAISGGDQSFVVQMLQLFIDTVPDSVKAIRAAADAGQWPDLSKLAHKLKSTIDSMGIVELKEDIRTIEARGKSDGDMTGIDLLVNKVEEVMTDVVAQVRKDYAL